MTTRAILERRSLAAFAWLALTLTGGCTEADKEIIGAAAKGQTCKQVSDCQAGLDCIEGICTPLEPLVSGPQRGTPCNGPADCAPDWVCGRQNVCTLSEGIGRDQPCGLTIECQEPLVCNGESGVCTDADPDGNGTLDFGETCTTITDCRRPYVCNLLKKCDRLPFYAGPDCTLSEEETGAFRVYFELPPETLPEPYEFYRLPFPNDIRIVNGRVSLAGHPSPNEVLGIGVPELYIDAVEEDCTGFAVNQPIFFRFSDRVMRESICLDPGSSYPESTDPEAPPFCTDHGEASVYLVNIDPSSLNYGSRIPVQLAMGTDKGQYICQNWLGIAPLHGQPLAHQTTYAAIITTTVRDIRDDAPIQDLDFANILAGTEVVAAMQPLLDWIDDRSIDASNLAAATVFTTDDPDHLAPKIRAAIHAQNPAPTFDSGSVLCNGSNTSPCDDGQTRGCSGSHAGYHEIQGTYAGPILQAGQRPYSTASMGGAITVDGDSVPNLHGTETMCFSLAVPTVAAPGDGFPIIIYGHGTGGSYRSFMDQSLGSTTLVEALTGLGFAVLGFDNVMHGPRQQPPGTSPVPDTWQDPGRLFFNLANPRAARGNVLQGAADLFHLVRLVRNPNTSLSGPEGTIRFDADAVFYLGHSQGTVIAPAFLAAEPDLRAAVLSGAGAELALSILNKKKPTDVGQVASAFFSDDGLSRVHPMMGLLSMIFGPADSASYAHTWTLQPTAGALPLLQFSGVGDSYTPDITQHALILATGLPLVAPVTVPIAGVAEVASPQQNNLNGVTAAAVQLATDGAYDGHFVMFNHPDAATTLTHFLATALAGTAEIQR